MKSWSLCFAGFLGASVLAAACASAETPAPAERQEPTRPASATADAAAASAPAPGDPLDEGPDTTEGLTNVSADLDLVLERGGLDGACARMKADPGSRRARLLCGKHMFFDEGFSTVGVPAAIFDFMGSSFPDQLGLAFSRMGLIADPRSKKNRPIGATVGAPLAGAETVAFGCATCHFGRLPDGRYAVGAPNLDYDYGAHILNLMITPQSVSPTWNASAHHPDALAATAAARGKLGSDMGLKMRLMGALLPMLGSAGSAQALTPEHERQYASWRPGTMDFLIAPLPLDDEVHTISKVLSLWGIPSAERERAAGMPHAMLGWTGGTRSLEVFLKGFVALGAGTAASYPPEVLAPMIEYLSSLRAPRALAAPPVERVEHGKRVFVEGGCRACHDGPGGMGKRIFSFEEIGTDPAIAYFADRDRNGKACCGLDDVDLTHGIKAPRLLGVWAFGKFLHNGALDSLEQLLCLDPRAATRELAHGAQGHAFGCGLPASDRRALIAYLKAH